MPAGRFTECLAGDLVFSINPQLVDLAGSQVLVLEDAYQLGAINGVMPASAARTCHGGNKSTEVRTVATSFQGHKGYGYRLNIMQ